MAGVAHKLASAAESYLQSGEVVQTAFYALSGAYLYNDCAVVVTNQRIMLFSLSFTGKLEQHISDIPRETRIGPAEGFLTYATSSLGVPLTISFRFYKEVAAADSWLSADVKAMPPTPLNRASRGRRWRERVLDFLSYGLESEFGVVLIAVAFVLISPWTIVKLARLAFRTADGKNSNKLRRRILVALAVNLGGWLLAAIVVAIAFVWAAGQG